VRFGLLGPLAVWAADGRTVTVPEVKVRALLVDLLIHEGRPLSVDRLLADLWGERLPGNPTNTLQTKISQLRRALEDVEPGSRGLVVRQPPGYLVRIEAGALDVQRFRALAAQARASPDPRARAALLSDALSLWRGPALADFADEPFARTVVDRLEEERVVAFEDRAEAQLALGEHSLLVGELGDLVAGFPLRERLRGLLMRALYRTGRQSEALGCYRELRTRLAAELGLEPGPEIAALHQAVLQQDPALEGAPSPVTSVARPATNLPTPLGELVGRASAVRAVSALVRENRLLTLTGSGGVGKTRLAVAAAHELTTEIRDGVRFVEFAGMDRTGHSASEEWVVGAVAAALDIREDPAPGAPPVDLSIRLADALWTTEILLVLDNCEHLIEPVSRLTERLLRGAPGLRILATSQESLGLAGEVVWNVPPLRVPVTDTADVGDYSAVQLFVARAAAAAPGFVLNEGNAAMVAAICRRLDGIPLALELAATKVRVLGTRELLNRLDDRFQTLGSGHRDAPARQQTLRAMIDWSWELLSPQERIVLRRLAIHSDGCSLDAAETGCAGEGVSPDEVLEILARLVARSLVVTQDHDITGPRYRLLESVATYCLERLHEAGEFEMLRLRHCRYYVALAERADPQLRGREQREWLERLDAEATNLRSAFDSLVQLGEADLALRLATTLTWYWYLRGRLQEALRSLSTALNGRR